ncbi:hypothetical protein BC830DRAFT_1126765 [Chytriomyces sp. MP71]|nr:hypothetical protein BC830DRAFT_1126765 [Chytriomyces sp. MP71]
MYPHSINTTQIKVIPAPKPNIPYALQYSSRTPHPTPKISNVHANITAARPFWLKLGTFTLRRLALALLLCTDAGAGSGWSLCSRRSTKRQK